MERYTLLVLQKYINCCFGKKHLSLSSDYELSFFGHFYSSLAYTFLKKRTEKYLLFLAVYHDVTIKLTSLRLSYIPSTRTQNRGIICITNLAAYADIYV